MESRVTPKNILIASFECDSFDVKNIVVLDDSSSYSEIVKSGIIARGKSIASQLKSRSRVTPEKKFVGKYYVAINFILLDYQEQCKKYKSIPIIKSGIPLIDTWIE